MTEIYATEKIAEQLQQMVLDGDLSIEEVDRAIRFYPDFEDAWDDAKVDMQED